MAAESIYKERCVPVNDGPSWAKYMLISGSPDDEYDIITLQYTEEGLLSVDENREGRAAAFGDDIAIECLATEFKREIYVVSNKSRSFHPGLELFLFACMYFFKIFHQLFCYVCLTTIFTLLLVLSLQCLVEKNLTGLIV